MFKSMKRIIKWAGKYKGRLYLGSVFSFFSSLSTAIPTMAAAYALDKAIAAYWAGNTIESSLIWQTLWIIVGSIALNFLLSYLRAVLQESIGYEVAAGQRIHLGDVLKRVPLGYFSKNSVGDILTGVTTELSTLELQGMKMVDIIINGYAKFIAILLCFLFLSPAAAVISVVGVAFSSLALHGISRHSEKTAATLCSLIARFYDVDAGKITLGETDIREFTCDSLLKNISMVFQNVYLFRDTIRNNIKFGSPDASEEQMIAAAKEARCHDFIMALPDGYDTVIGEGGSSLSGGEKQRISIARAMLKDAPIVILDEATASIDPENEHLIQEAISALTHGKTIITIAHRLATIENADQILVIDGGTVVQKGTHKELLAQRGTYQEFIKIREQAEGWRIQQ